MISKKIIISLSVIGAVAVIAIGATTALFSDTETSIGNIFTAGTLNLQIGNEDPTIWFYSAGDIKPGDENKEFVSIQNTGSLDGYLHITFANLVDEDVSCTEPEREAEGGDCGIDGELAENLDILIYIDENGSANFDLGIDTLVYQGKAKGILQGDLFNYFLPAGTLKYDEFVLERKLDSSVGNIVQSDKTGFDINFELTQNKKEDIVGDWHFNENAGTTAYDSSGYGNNGTISEIGMWAQYGKYNPALSFDGSNDNIVVNDSASLEPEKVTLEAWVKRDGTPGAYKYIAGKQFSGNNGSYNFYTGGSGGLRFYIGYSATQWIPSPDAGTSVWDGSWHHIVGTYDGVKVRLYKDGTEVGSGTATTENIDYNTSNFYIGSYGAGFYFSGLIDEVRVYSRDLNGSEVLARYNIGI